MSNREAKSQARQWVDSPEILAEDLRKLFGWVESTAFIPAPSESAEPQSGLIIDFSRASEIFDELKPIDRALWEYRRMLPETLITYEMFQPLMESLNQAAESSEGVQFNGLAEIETAISAIEYWSRKQSWKSAEAPLRSEILKATIEEEGEELILRTDKDGSIKLRGRTNIPMFLAFWQAPKHRLSMEIFLDIDPGTKLTYLERHRTRLCAQLQKVLLEVVVEGNGFRMQRCR